MHELMSFLDAYSGYNQFRMHRKDQENPSFITKFDTYYYNAMPFEHKNAGAIYQRLVNKIFENKLVKQWRYI